MKSSWLTQVLTSHSDAPDQAAIYGVVLYTNAHANIKKILDDSDYRSAFDEISGQSWAVYAVCAEQGKSEFPEMSQGNLGFLVPIWKEPKANKEIIEAFGLDSTKDCPSLLVFANDLDGSVLKRIVRLSDESVDEAYISLKSALELVANAVKGVETANFKNGAGVFTAVNFAIDQDEQFQKFKQGIQIYRWLKGFIP